MAKKEYFFQKKKRSFAQKFFEKGFDATSYVLLGLHEAGKGFLKGLPSSYPGFALMKWTFGVDQKQPKFKKETIRKNLSRLTKQGLIAKDPKQKVHYLTEQGKEFVSYIENRFLILKKPWDGKLRIVVFDVPEKKKHWREVIRQELVLMQFQQLQKSVYVGKHPLSESFCQEMEEAGIAEYVFIFTVAQVDRREDILRLLEDEDGQ